MLRQRVICRRCRADLGVMTMVGPNEWEADAIALEVHAALSSECAPRGQLGIDLLPLPLPTPALN